MKVKLIAPSSGLKAGQNREEILEKIVNIMQESGVEVIYNPEILTTQAILPFFADSEEFRRSDLKDSLESEEYSIIWTLRGGYGCTSLVYNVFWANVIPKKILIGYSDITALHILMNNYLGFPSIHGPSLLEIANGQATFESIDTILSSNSSIYYIAKIYGYSDFYLPITSKVIGGNLTVLTSLIGTEFEPKFEGTIVLLEDIGEAPDKVHRSLFHLKNAGLFNNADAVLFGDFIKNETNEIDQDFAELMTRTIDSFCKDEIEIPSFRIEGIGHGQYSMAICLGTEAKISACDNTDMFSLEVSSINF